MNLTAFPLPGIAADAKPAAPGFDILVAVSAARQAASPTACAVQAWERTALLPAQPDARRRLLAGERRAAGTAAPHFFDRGMDPAAAPVTGQQPK